MDLIIGFTVCLHAYRKTIVFILYSVHGYVIFVWINPVVYTLLQIHGHQKRLHRKLRRNGGIHGLHEKSSGTSVQIGQG